MAEVTRAGRRPGAEDRKRNLHRPAGREADAVVALGVGLRTAEENAAGHRPVQCVDLRTGHRNRPRAVGDPATDRDRRGEVRVNRGVIDARFQDVGHVERRLVIPPLRAEGRVARAEEDAHQPAGRNDQRVPPRRVGTAECEPLAARNRRVVRGHADAAERISRCIRDSSLDERAEDDIEVPVGRVSGPDCDVRRALEVRRPAGNPCPPLHDETSVRGCRDVQPVGALPDGQPVVPGRVGIRSADSLAARHRAAKARADEDVRHRDAAGTAHDTGNQEAAVEPNVDAVLVRDRA